MFFRQGQIQNKPLNCVIEANPSKGLHAVFVGNILAATNSNILAQHDIKAVLTVAADLDFRYTDPSILHKRIDAIDLPSYDLERHFPEIVQFIADARAKSNVLVHCRAGISRSSSSVLAYMIDRLGISLQSALASIREKRPIICPNDGFLRQLKNFQRSVKARKEAEAKEVLKKQSDLKITVKSLREPVKQSLPPKAEDKLKVDKEQAKVEQRLMKGLALSGQATFNSVLGKRPPVITTIPSTSAPSRGVSQPFQSRTHQLWEGRPNYHYTKK